MRAVDLCIHGILITDRLEDVSMCANMAAVDDIRSGTSWTRKEKGQLRTLLKDEKVVMSDVTYLWCCSASDVIKTRSARAIQAHLMYHQDEYF